VGLVVNRQRRRPFFSAGPRSTRARIRLVESSVSLTKDPAAASQRMVVDDGIEADEFGHKGFLQIFRVAIISEIEIHINGKTAIIFYSRF
jgi:hypothetical protein